MKNIIPIIKPIAAAFGLDWVAVAAFISVETGGKGFDEKTGKLIIQFEPVWFRRKAAFAPSGLWSLNKVEVQSKEWIAFNDAFKKDKEAAMNACSIGLGQIMGFHFKRLGFASVGAMWDDAKKGLENQIRQICLFIMTDEKLRVALLTYDWVQVATIYNGSGFRQLAAKYGRVPYDEAMSKEYEKFKSLTYRKIA